MLEEFGRGRCGCRVRGAADPGCLECDWAGGLGWGALRRLGIGCVMCARRCGSRTVCSGLRAGRGVFSGARPRRCAERDGRGLFDGHRLGGGRAARGAPSGRTRAGITRRARRGTLAAGRFERAMGQRHKHRVGEVLRRPRRSTRPATHIRLPTRALLARDKRARCGERHSDRPNISWGWCARGRVLGGGGRWGRRAAGW